MIDEKNKTFAPLIVHKNLLWQCFLEGIIDQDQWDMVERGEEIYIRTCQQSGCMTGYRVITSRFLQVKSK